MKFDLETLVVGITENKYTSKRTNQPAVFYNAQLIENKKVFSVRANKDLYEKYKDLENEKRTVTLEVTEFNGAHSLNLVEIKD